ncbi:hypothetical protein RB653_006432 [Dictyostelium firmibasis]|uniref:Uncharacterized protein n=1 Tax=Dictyostelium firmibasis TaxID=79012 RepID=A0AAN7UC07_9MYCE
MVNIKYNNLYYKKIEFDYFSNVKPDLVEKENKNGGENEYFYYKKKNGGNKQIKITDINDKHHYPSISKPQRFNYYKIVSDVLQFIFENSEQVPNCFSSIADYPEPVLDDRSNVIIYHLEPVIDDKRNVFSEQGAKDRDVLPLISDCAEHGDKNDNQLNVYHPAPVIDDKTNLFSEQAAKDRCSLSLIADSSEHGDKNDCQLNLYLPEPVTADKNEPLNAPHGLEVEVTNNFSRFDTNKNLKMDVKSRKAFVFGCPGNGVDKLDDVKNNLESVNVAFKNCGFKTSTSLIYSKDVFFQRLEEFLQGFSGEITDIIFFYSGHGSLDNRNHQILWVNQNQCIEIVEIVDTIRKHERNKREENVNKLIDRFSDSYPGVDFFKNMQKGVGKVGLDEKIQSVINYFIENKRESEVLDFSVESKQLMTEEIYRILFILDCCRSQDDINKKMGTELIPRGVDIIYSCKLFCESKSGLFLSALPHFLSSSIIKGINNKEEENTEELMKRLGSSDYISGCKSHFNIVNLNYINSHVNEIQRELLTITELIEWDEGPSITTVIKSKFEKIAGTLSKLKYLIK